MAEEKYGALLWAETPITPDEPDVLDGGDVVEGIGGSWRQVRRVVGCDRLFGVVWCFLVLTMAHFPLLGENK